jgi:hypothetical protein
MKFRVTMKDPDTLSDAIDEAVEESTSAEVLVGFSDEEREAVAEKRREAYSAIAGKWIEYGEYLTVEIDTEAKTCTVIPHRGS